MKKSLWLITLVALCILTCSCGQKEQQLELPTYERITESQLEYGEIETGTVAGDYIYRSMEVSGMTLLLKYHIPTGTVSPVCQDPFCTHERYASSCQFTVRTFRIASIGNILYYVIEIDGQHHLRAYDGDAMTIDEVRISDGVLTRLFRYNYYLYFTEILPTKNEGETKTTVYRVDTRSGALEVIDCGRPYAEIELIEVGRIVWAEGEKYFSTDLDGDDARVYEQDYCREWGKYKLRWEWGGKAYEKIYCKDLTVGEEVLIAEDVADFYVYGDKMVYFKFAPVRIVMDDSGVEVKDYYGGNVYIVNLDGSDNRLLCHVEDFVFLCGSSDRNNEFICGDWIGFISESYHVSSGNTPELLVTNMLLVNVISGEYRLIKYNPYEM